MHESATGPTLRVEGGQDGRSVEMLGRRQLRRASLVLGQHRPPDPTPAEGGIDRAPHAVLAGRAVAHVDPLPGRDRDGAAVELGEGHVARRVEVIRRLGEPRPLAVLGDALLDAIGLVLGVDDPHPRGDIIGTGVRPNDEARNRGVGDCGRTLVGHHPTLLSLPVRFA
jgi:hypothetical protein